MAPCKYAVTCIFIQARNGAVNLNIQEQHAGNCPKGHRPGKDQLMQDWEHPGDTHWIFLAK
jgi:hypothetical protein